MYKENNVLEIIKKRRPRQAGHAQRSQNPLLGGSVETEPDIEKTIRKTKNEIKNVVKKNVEALGGGLNGKFLMMNRDN